MEQVSVDIKMRMVFSLPGKPRGRGIVERFFATLNQLLLCDLPGYMPSGQYPPKPPTLKLNELDVYIKEFFIEKFNRRIHAETNMEPQERWEKGSFIPRLPQSLEQLDLLLLTEAKSRKIHPDGIHFQKFKYIDTTLAAYVGEEVTIRYDPRDMAEIKVYYRNSFLCRAVSQILARDTISLKEIIRARNARKKQLRGAIKCRSEMVDLLLAAHNEAPVDYADFAKNDTKIAKEDRKKDNKTKLKRYYNE